MLDKFAINFRGVTITPQLRKDNTLLYTYNNVKVSVLYDNNVYHTLFYKSDYEAWVKDLAISKLGEIVCD